MAELGAGRRLSTAGKAVYALGDHTVNVVLSSTAFFYLIFLTTVVGMRPALAGAVVWIARGVDAFSDPLMGRLSDRSRWRSGRRRPWFLLGALPFGGFFALMWGGCPLPGESGRFLWYTAVYCGMSLATTVVSVPYLALIPEMATGYDERTSVNTWRAAFAVLGTLVAAGLKPLADALGDGGTAWGDAGLWLAAWLVLPWLAVHRVSFERPEFGREARLGLREGARLLLRHRSFGVLAAIYVLSRIAYDLISAMFLLFFQFYLGRPQDFFPTMALFLLVATAALPGWLRLSVRYDKRTVLVAGASWWLCAQLLIFAVDPGWPPWSIYVVAALAALGFAVMDMMPWSMIGDVVDEDELRSGERREGLYLGSFMFLRKLGGATGVLLAGVVLDLGGYAGGSADGQGPAAVASIRALTAFGPAFFLALSIAAASRYPLGRAAHARILERLGRGAELRSP